MPKNYTSNLGIYSQDKNLKSYLQIKPVLHLPPPTPTPPHPLKFHSSVCSQLGVSPSKLFLAAMAFGVHIMQLLAKPRVCKELLLENHSDSGHSRSSSSGSL